MVCICVLLCWLVVIWITCCRWIWCWRLFADCGMDLLFAFVGCGGGVLDRIVVVYFPVPVGLVVCLLVDLWV